MASRFRHACVVSALVSLSIGCHGKLDVAPTGNDAGTLDPPGAIPFEPVSARIYVAKVKNLMLGLPPAEEEIAAVEADPTALRGLVDAWFVRPEAQAKLGTFFSKAFQQTQIGPADFFDQITVDNLPNLPLFAQLQESMSRTALKTIANGKPFTDTVTTHTFMMTPTMMSLYLALDQVQVDDAGKASLSVPMPDGSLSTTQPFWLTYRPPVDPSATPVVANPIPLAETLDPGSPNFMHFAVPAAFTCSVPQLDDTGHVVVDAKGAAVKVTVSYNQRKYTNVIERVPGAVRLRGPQLRERSQRRQRSADDHHPRRRDGRQEDALPVQLRRRRRRSRRPTSLRMDDGLAPGHGARGDPGREADAVLRSAHAARRLRDRGAHPARRLLLDARVLRQLDDEQQQPAPRHAEPGVDRRRSAAASTRSIAERRRCSTTARTASTPTRPAPATAATRRWIRCGTCSGRRTRTRTTRSTTRRRSSPARRSTTSGRRRRSTSFDDFASALVSHPLYATAWTQKLCYLRQLELVRRGRSGVRARRRRRSPIRTTTFTSWCWSCSPRRWSPGRTRPRPGATWGRRSASRVRITSAPALTNRLGLTTSLCTGITDKTTRDGRGHQRPPGRLPARRRDACAVDVGDPVLPRGDRVAVRVRGRPDHRQDQQPLRQHQEGRRDHRLRGEHHGHHVGRPGERHGHPVAQRPLRRGDGGRRHAQATR